MHAVLVDARNVSLSQASILLMTENIVQHQKRRRTMKQHLMILKPFYTILLMNILKNLLSEKKEK